jgi:hypothetical protein
VATTNALELAEALVRALGITRFGEVAIRVSDGQVTIVKPGLTLDRDDLKKIILQ